MIRKTHICVGFAVVAGLLAAAPAGATTLSWGERAVLAEMNRVRAVHHRAPLRVDARLQRAARSHSADMLRRDYFAHGAFAARMSRFGVLGPRTAENIAWGSGRQAAARALVAAWLRSPAHRANLLRPGFRRVGVAAPVGILSGYRARVVTADFAGT